VDEDIGSKQIRPFSPNDRKEPELFLTNEELETGFF
jgi:hypothetical protein